MGFERGDGVTTRRAASGAVDEPLGGTFTGLISWVGRAPVKLFCLSVFP